MKRDILIFGIVGGVLIAVLQFIQYRFLVIEHSLQIYGGIVAIIFASVGIWLGLKLTRKETIIKEVPVPATPFVRDVARVETLGLTPRELEILEHIAAGLSNREIAGRLFVSENTVKTHSARVFGKLNARRRTQAVQLAKEQRLIP